MKHEVGRKNHLALLREINEGDLVRCPECNKGHPLYSDYHEKSGKRIDNIMYFNCPRGGVFLGYLKNYGLAPGRELFVEEKQEVSNSCDNTKE